MSIVPDGKPQEIVIELNVKEQRLLAQSLFGGPVFRMWLTDLEADAVQRMEGTTTLGKLRDGRWCVWRAESSLNGIPAAIREAVAKRRVTDDA